MATHEQSVREIDVQKLKQIVDTILDRMINRLKVSSISINDGRDYYWDVPSDTLFSVRDNQPQLDSGRLSDDWDLLQNILTDSENGVSLMLIHVAPLLRFIGEKIGQ